MTATQSTQKTAETSTPSAAPAGSRPAEEKPTKTAPAAQADTGADAEEVTTSDVLAALGELSDRSKTDGVNREVAEEETEEAGTPEGVAAEAGTAEEATGEKPSGESEEEAAESGDAAGTESGAVETEAEKGGEAEAAGEKPGEEAAKPTRIQQRIDELTARAKTAEQELAQASERLAAFDAEAASSVDSRTLEHIDTPEQLGRYRQQLVTLHQRLLKSPQGIELPDPNEKGKTIQYDADGVADLLGQTFSLLHQDVPAREQFLREREAYEEAAAVAYPWIKDTRQGPGAQVQAAIQQNPALRRMGPNYRLVTADALVGQTLRQAGIQVTPQLVARLRAELAKKPAGETKPAGAQSAPRRQPPPAPGRAGVLPARQSPREAQGGAAMRRLRKGDGNVNDLAASIATGL